ncbi:MAG TPA: hypothetical protein PLC42_01840 [Parachlamydiaceae bacterium]|nr:hypothetical protein [Parachlamydiaceae bacterium]
MPLVSAEIPSEEVAIINSLILSTKKSVAMQEKIRGDIIHYQKVNKAFLQNPNNPELLFQMLTSAGPLFKNLQSSHLIENFPPDFINELKLFAEIDSKGHDKP